MVQDEIIKLLGRDYADSTIGKNFKILSLPMNELKGHCYIETCPQRSTRGRPAIRGKLSQAASDVLFRLADSHTLDDIGAPASLQIGKVVIPPVKITTKWLLPKDIVALRKQKIGEKEADRLLRDVADGVCAEDFYDLKHHTTPGRIPKLRRLTREGVKEYAADTNQMPVHTIAYIAPNWIGIWETDFGKLEIVLETANENPMHIGRYSNGTIEGRAEADTLIGTWHEGANSGDFKFTMFAGGHSFWGDRYDGPHRKAWNGRTGDEIEVAQSGILKDEKLPMGNIVSERASRPLISEKSPEVRKEVIQQEAKY